MPVPPLRTPPSRLLACAVMAFSPAVWSVAQTESDARQSGLGHRFVAIPGTHIEFATFETRLKEFKTFTQSANHTWSFIPHFPQDDSHPVVGVNLPDALAFCTWLTESDRTSGRLNSAQLYRLPTDAEWDAAAGLARSRSLGSTLTTEETLADQRRFPWGLTWPPPIGAGNLAEGDIPNYTDPYRHTAPVGQFNASMDGIYDLAGNVWEWTLDAMLTSKVTGHLRGGSWAYFNEDSLRSSYVYEVSPDLRVATVGFRLVFEDRQRTGKLFAESQKQRDLAREAIRDRMLATTQTDSTPEAISTMRERIVRNADPIKSPAPATLAPAKAGVPHTNSFGMKCLPLADGRTLLCQTEVTAQQYELFLKATRQTWEDKPPHITRPDHPAAGVSWTSASAFCGWLTRSQREEKLIPAGANYRLPTDTEWSQAAGLDTLSGTDPKTRNGQTPDHFPWTPDTAWPPPRRAANLDASKIPGFDDPHAYTCPINANDPNERGFYELAGNVAEWCADPWPDSPNDHVLRGGSWLSFSREDLLTSKRSHAPKDASRANFGFRCALELPTVP